MAGVAVLGGWIVAVSGGVARREAALALLAAWTVQVLAFAVLAYRLARGRNATRAWVAGIVLRGGALLTAWPAVRLGLISRDVAVVFGLGLTVLIILEAAWLAMIPTHRGSQR